MVLDSKGDEAFKITLPDNIQTTALISETTNSIFVGCFDGCMYCLDLPNQRENWKFSTGNSIVSSPRFCQNKSAIVFGSYDENLYCLEIKVRYNVNISFIRHFDLIKNLMFIILLLLRMVPSCGTKR